MTRWTTLVVLLLVLGGIATPYADPEGPGPKVPSRGTEGPDVSAKIEPDSLVVSFPSTVSPVGHGVEGPETR